MGGSASCPEVGPGWDRLGAHEVAVDLTGHITLQAPHDLPEGASTGETPHKGAKATRRTAPDWMQRARSVLDALTLFNLTSATFERAATLDPEDCGVWTPPSRRRSGNG
jgi:hypothetical protein